MSRYFRAVVETWSEANALVPPDAEVWEVANFLEEIANDAGLSAKSDSYEDKEAFWVTDGGAFLDKVDSLDEDRYEDFETVMDLDPDVGRLIIRGLKENAAAWRQFIDPKSGGLRIYIDSGE